MKLSLKGLFAALLFSIGIGVASNGVAQDIAPINVNSADPHALLEPLCEVFVPFHRHITVLKR